MPHRKRKKAIIISIYFVLFVGIIWIIASMIRPEPSCSDGKRNGTERGVDCGGECRQCEIRISAEPIEISSAHVMRGTDGTFDVVAEIVNPNHQFGSGYIAYNFIFKDEAGDIISQKSGETFILPAETKYILSLSIDVKGKVIDSAHLKITSAQWQEFTDFEEPQITVLNKRYDLISSGTGFSEIYSLIRNESSYDFNTIGINVVLKNNNGVPIALQKTTMETLDSGISRDFLLKWPQKFPGEVATFDVEIEANVFDVQTFRKKYLRGDY